MIRAILSPLIFDGTAWHNDAALLIDSGVCAGIVSQNTIPQNAQIEDCRPDMLVPGFVDLQVNGGGGVMFNERPDADGIATICAAHARFGTTALLATLITDTPAVMVSAIEAGCKAADRHVPGFLGLHLEGPHLSVNRKGAHRPDFIRLMTREDMDRLRVARNRLPLLMTTVAPESVTPEQVRQLSAAGVQVSLGHTDCGFTEARNYTDAGASLITHLFNAMSPLQHREPGLVGAALADGRLSAGLIADGFHVDPAVIGIALRAKQGPGHVFLVTDAMSTIGTEAMSFEINGRTVYRNNGRLTLEDGTLAGADIDMAASIRFLHQQAGVPLETALMMASRFPADAVGLKGKKGCLDDGADADFVALDSELNVNGTWIGGESVFSGNA
jgi:N-acetylglucosamine-6-phosphate deacetylase